MAPSLQPGGPEVLSQQSSRYRIFQVHSHISDFEGGASPVEPEMTAAPANPFIAACGRLEARRPIKSWLGNR